MVRAVRVTDIRARPLTRPDGTADTILPVTAAPRGARTLPSTSSFWSRLASNSSPAEFVPDEIGPLRRVVRGVSDSTLAYFGAAGAAGAGRAAGALSEGATDLAGGGTGVRGFSLRAA